MIRMQGFFSLGRKLFVCFKGRNDLCLTNRIRICRAPRGRKLLLFHSYGIPNTKAARDNSFHSKNKQTITLGKFHQVWLAYIFHMLDTHITSTLMWKGAEVFLPVPSNFLVEYTFSWVEMELRGPPHMCHASFLLDMVGCWWLEV